MRSSINNVTHKLDFSDPLSTPGNSHIFERMYGVSCLVMAIFLEHVALYKTSSIFLCGNPRLLPSTDDQTPSSDAQTMHRQLNGNSTIHNNQTEPQMHPMDTDPVQSEAPQQPGIQSLSLAPSGLGTRTRFTACPPGGICPSAGCCIPHHNNIGRLTRH